MSIENHAEILHHRSPDWWRDAVIYQIYPKSWADANGDGYGDCAGVRARLPYLAELGIDAIWFSPFYRSPDNDGGYDVADYRDIDPRFGTVDEVVELVREAHDLGIKIIVDIVPNHTSSEHRYFQAALRTAPGSPEWERYHVLPGKGVQHRSCACNWAMLRGTKGGVCMQHRTSGKLGRAACLLPAAVRGECSCWAARV